MIRALTVSSLVKFCYVQIYNHSHSFCVQHFSEHISTAGDHIPSSWQGWRLFMELKLGESQTSTRMVEGEGAVIQYEGDSYSQERIQIKPCVTIILAYQR